MDSNNTTNHILWRNKDEVLEDLQKYCMIPSGSSNLKGVYEAQNFLNQILVSTLNFETTFVENPLGSQISAPLLHSSFHPQSKTRIAFISHADTLDGHEFDQQRYSVTLTKDKIIGQGVLDDKASQFVALWGLQMFLEKHPHTKLGFDFISSPNEELGSRGYHKFYENLSKKVTMALGFEPSLQDGSIVSERRGNRWYKIEVTGREAHAGRGHKFGCNAIHELATKIYKLQKLTNYKKDITLNIGQIISESMTYNVVSGKAMAKLDLRFSTLKARNDVHRKIQKILDKSYVRSAEDRFASQTRYLIEDDCPPLHLSRKSKKWVIEYLSCLEAAEGNTRSHSKSGGGADVCYMAHKELIVIDGLGAIGGNMHRQDEYALSDSIESRAIALFKFLEVCEKSL